MKPLALSFQGMVLPLCVSLWIIEFIDLLVKCVRESSSEQVECLDVVEIVPSVSSKTFEFGYIVVHVFPFHLEALLQSCLGTFLLQGIGEISTECAFHSRPQPDIGESNSVGGDLINEPPVLGLDPFIDVWSLKVGEE